MIIILKNDYTSPKFEPKPLYLQGFGLHLERMESVLKYFKNSIDSKGSLEVTFYHLIHFFLFR